MGDDSKRDRSETMYSPTGKPFLKTSVKILLLIIAAICILMFLYNRNQAKMMQLQEIGNEIAARIPTSFDPEPQYSLDLDENCVLCRSKSRKKIHLVTTFFPMSVIAGQARFLNPGADWTDHAKPSLADSKRMVQERDRELLDVLQMNLNNNNIIAIHIIYSNEKVVNHIINQRLRFTHKLIFHWVQSPSPTYEDAMLYIGKYLLDQLVVFANQDIYFGKGWNILDHEKIKERKLMYALTRHGKQERYVFLHA